MEDELVDVGRQLVAAEVGDAAVLVRLAHGEEASPRKSSTGTPAGSPRRCRGRVEMLTRRHRILAPWTSASASSSATRAPSRRSRSRVPRARGSRRPRQANPRLHVGPDLLDARPQPPAHRRGRALGVRRGRPPELLDALRAGARARGAARRPLPGAARPRPPPTPARRRTRSRSRWRRCTPAAGRSSASRAASTAPLRHRLRELLDGARRLRAGAARRVRDSRAVRVPLPGAPLRRRLRLHVPGGRLRARRPAVRRPLCALVAEPVLRRRDHRPARRLLPAGARAARRARDAPAHGRGPDGLRAPGDDVRVRARRVVPDLVGVSKTLGGGPRSPRRSRRAAIEQDCYEKGFLHVTSHVSDPLPCGRLWRCWT